MEIKPHHEVYGYSSLEVGDSLFVPVDGIKVRFIGKVHSYGQYHNKKFSCRSSETGVRIWRIK